MKSADKKKSEDFYKLFKPQLTPKKMLEMGVFGGSYFGRKIKEYPKLWFKNGKLSKTFDVKKNRFKVKAGLTRKEWLDKGWIFKEDPLGWFQWYCRFTNGRRIPRIDEIQIKRWKAFKRHVAAIKKNCEPRRYPLQKKTKTGHFTMGLQSFYLSGCIICCGSQSAISGKIIITTTAKIIRRKSGKALFAIKPISLLAIP